jgi:hypothetical protein
VQASNAGGKESDGTEGRIGGLACANGLPYAEARNHVPRTGRQLLRQTQPPANYPTTGKTSGGSRPQSDSRANTVSIPVERLTAGIFKGGLITILRLLFASWVNGKRKLVLGRVESRTGAVALASRWLLGCFRMTRLNPVWLDPVSCSRSSNRTGRFPASGSRKRHTPP